MKEFLCALYAAIPIVKLNFQIAEKPKKNLSEALKRKLYISNAVMNI
jgi:hypothetical protein